MNFWAKILNPKTLKKLALEKWRNILLLIAAISLLSLFYFFILKDLPSPTILGNQEGKQSTQILDRNGKLLFNVYKSRNQTFVPLENIPKNVQNATIAIEDKNFYNHGAIDLKGIARSAFEILFHNQIQGGSTLTQQLVKNNLLSPERTILRKVREIILSFATEAVYSKSKILEMYLNQTPYGGTSWGIEAAAQAYFGKNAKNLNLAESALLAGLPESPTVYSPFGSRPELAKQRQIEVLETMYQEKYISKSQKEKAEKETLNYKRFSTDIKAPHFSLFIKDLLEQKYGEKLVEEGGLRVITSLDLSIQNFAQDAVATEVAKLANVHITNGASIVTNPATGEILAMVGSKDYFDKDTDGNVNVTIAERQPGSSIKPLNYALGLIKGSTAATPFIDKQTCYPNPGSKPYCPVNYDGKFRGVLQMRYALGNSINIPAVKMLKLNGVEAMIATASAMGITTWKESGDYGLSLTLGGGEIKMYDMAEAYGVFANGGYKINLHPILKVTRNGKVLEEYTPPKSPIFGKKILPAGVSFIISDILSDNGARLLEFGANSKLKVPNKIVSVKTGTTNDFRDNWTIGYTPSFVVAVWVGNNDNTPMTYLASGITGAAPIWNTIMSHLLENKTQEPLIRPSTVVQKEICSTSGLIPPLPGTAGRCATRFEYFIKGTEPKRFDGGQQENIWVYKDSQIQAAVNAPGDSIELKSETVITDATGDKYCTSCAQPTPVPSPTP